MIEPLRPQHDTYRLSANQQHEYAAIVREVDMEDSMTFQEPAPSRERLLVRLGSYVAIAASLAGGVVVGEQLGVRTVPSIANVRTEAFTDPQVLLMTSTCAEELTYEKARLDALPARGSATDKAVHPDAAAYENAILFSRQYNIPCGPVSDLPAVASVTVKGMEVHVSGGSTVVAGGDAVPLLDAGSDVYDTCVVGAPDTAAAGISPLLARATSQFVQTAEQYCR